MTEQQQTEQVSAEQEETQQEQTQETQQEQQTFDAEYVKGLRKEAAATRTKLRKLEEAEEQRTKAALTETERLKAEKEAAETKATEATTKANQRAVRSEARVQALEAGVKPERVTAILRLSDLSEVEVDDDGEPDTKALKSAISATLKEYPEFKAGASVGGSGSNPASGNGNEGKNPWTKEHFNLTEQGNITLQDPAKAERLRQAAQG